MTSIVMMLPMDGLDHDGQGRDHGDGTFDEHSVRYRSVADFDCKGFTGPQFVFSQLFRLMAFCT